MLDSFVYGCGWKKVVYLFSVLLLSSFVPLGLLGLNDRGCGVLLVLDECFECDVFGLMMVGLSGWVGSLMLVVRFKYLRGLMDKLIIIG